MKFNNVFSQFYNMHAFPSGTVVKDLPASAGDARSSLGLGGFLTGGNGNPFQDSWWGNPKDRGAWWATVHGSPRVRHH